MRDFQSEVDPDAINLRERQRAAVQARKQGPLVGTSLSLGAGTRLVRILAGSASLNFGNTAAQTSADLTITVTGAQPGDMLALGVPNGSVNANSCFTAWVSAADTVTVRFNNYSAGAIDPASGTFTALVFGAGW